MKRYIRSEIITGDKYFTIDYEAVDNDSQLEEYGGDTALCAKNQKEAEDFMNQWAKARNITFTDFNIEPIKFEDIPEAWDIVNVSDGIDKYI